MTDTIQRLSHPRISLIGIAMARDLVSGLHRHRDDQASALTPKPEPQTFMGIEIIDDSAMPSGTFDIITDAEAFAERFREIRLRDLVAGAGVKPA
ncbi:hypothetical protein J4G43_027760 [Bradyrhizobium barranii subsp. barranii]|uniref:Uncharacterized protein n=1 Tax=Bradyrhizobium barranii subsp. barranii TaxID=2823807 RepID=A0A939S5W9_9BRAD|nr:hypothetical protein [Bradyrhizobium barranii]UEM08574.1 hypothetical protein J4G43_027760 [Bradyrhizobium barranii subsp. barranii]